MRIIAGTARSRIIDAPPGKDTRPTLDRVRENLFNMLQSEIHDTRILDLFAGSGALSFESLSRGSSYAVLCDHDRNANRIEIANTEKLGFSDRTRILLCDWSAAVQKLDSEHERFDIIFLDPPYVMAEDMTEVMNRLISLLSENGIVILEHEAKVIPKVPERYETIKERNWGYCGVTFYRVREEEETV